MEEFNLEEALAGAKVVTRDGREVKQVTCFDDVAGYNPMIVYGVVNGEVYSWTAEGFYHSEGALCDGDLMMAPKKLGGFVNVYNDLSNPFSLHANKMEANTVNNMTGVDRIACIDLSQFDEGHGL